MLLIPHVLRHPRRPLEAGGGSAVALCGPGCAPTAEAIERSAYFAYLDQGSQAGSDVRHWLDAETALRAGSGRPQIPGNERQH